MTAPRRRLPMAQSPTADRAIWDALFREGDILDGSGPLTHLRPATRGIHAMAVSFWLGFLASDGVDLAAEAPMDRITDARLERYLGALDGLSSASKAQWVHRLWLTSTPRHPSGPGRAFARPPCGSSAWKAAARRHAALQQTSRPLPWLISARR